ncbi:MAG: serine hydrolase [Candidatus Woesearchaeota archaeon]|nr:serine hydrolase [Candidatus Woesearchaeota archaeon]
MEFSENSELKKGKKRVIMIGIILLLILITTNLFLLLKQMQTNNIPTPDRAPYRYINHLTATPVDSGNQPLRLRLHYYGLKEKLTSDIEPKNNISQVGIFVQDLRTGAWMGINERDAFIPASLLKMPIMIGFLKKVDREQIRLNDTISLISADVDKNSGELYKKPVGTEFTSIEFLKEMILASDNTAKNAVLRQLSDADLNSVFAHVGMPQIENRNTTVYVTPRGYSRFFKALYFSSYLSPKSSELALDVTTDTQREDLLSAGIPVEVQVAHKFGVSDYGLHDCGVVYYPNNPYIICVMTRDIPFREAKNLITLVSKDVFEYVDAD